jgi:hypothetical protein
VKTAPRERPVNVKERIVKQNGYKNFRPVRLKMANNFTFGAE